MSSGTGSKKNIVEDLDDVVFIPKSKRSDLGIGVKRVFRPEDVTAPVSPSPPPDPLLASKLVAARTATTQGAATPPSSSTIQPQPGRQLTTKAAASSMGDGAARDVQQQPQQSQANPDRDLLEDLKMKHRTRHEYYLESKETLTNALAEVHTRRDGTMQLANMNPQGRGRGRGRGGRGHGGGPHRRY